MLVLSRRIGEEIKIGPDITIRVIATKKGEVKIGIAAPDHIDISRPDSKKQKK